MARPPGSRSRPKPANLRQFRGHTDQIQALDFSPDGTTIASSAHDGTVRTWDVSTGAEVRAFHPKVGPLHSVAFAPDGLTLAFTSDKGHVGLLDLDR
jgi:WD40 repeat protein